MRASSSTASSSPSKCFISFQLMPLRIALQPWMSYQVRWRWCLWCLLCPLQSSILIWIFLKMRNEIGVLPTWIKIWNEFINVELSILSSNVFFRLLIWCKRITFVIRFFSIFFVETTLEYNSNVPTVNNILNTFLRRIRIMA